MCAQINCVAMEIRGKGNVSLELCPCFGFVAFRGENESIISYNKHHNSVLENTR